jgi:hypothetical protein
MEGTTNVTTAKSAKHDDVSGVKPVGGSHHCQIKALIRLSPNHFS